MDGAKSIIEIPDLANRAVTSNDVYNRIWTAIERNPDSPNYNKEVKIVLLWDEVIAPHEKESKLYHPSALQKFSDNGWMRCEPYYYAKWKVLKRYDSRDKEDLVLFYRTGYRMDSYQIYYNWGPYAGLHFE